MRTIKSEFPDYDGEELHIAPFVCEPWHNDMCPRYVCRFYDGGEATLWVDYVEYAKREVGGYRFWLAITDPDEEIIESFAGETEASLREDLNLWYEERAGLKPRSMPLGDLMAEVARYILEEVEP